MRLIKYLWLLIAHNSAAQISPSDIAIPIDVTRTSLTDHRTHFFFFISMQKWWTLAITVMKTLNLLMNKQERQAIKFYWKREGPIGLEGVEEEDLGVPGRLPERVRGMMKTRSPRSLENFERKDFFTVFTKDYLRWRLHLHPVLVAMMNRSCRWECDPRQKSNRTQMMLGRSAASCHPCLR